MASITAKKRKKREKYSLEELKILGHHLLSSRVHINNLPVLITFISPSSRPQHALESLLSLQSFFFPVLSELARSSSKPIVDGGEDDSNIDPEVVYRSWLRAKFDEFVQSLIALAVSPDSAEALRDVALDAIMEFVKKGKEGKFQSAIYHRFLNGIVYSALPVDFLLDLLASKFFKYIDVRYFTYISLDKLARSLETTKASGQGSLRVDGKDDNLSNTSVELSIHKMYYILSHVSPLKDHDGKSDYENWSEQGFSSTEIDHKGASEILHPKEGQKKTKKFNSDLLSTPNIVKRMKLKFTKAWLSFLRLPLPLDVYKEVLVTLHQAVIPHMSNPALLCDFLTRSYDIGGVISVMALSGLYILMIQHGLEYPNFYEKLYALPLPSIFMAKHRSKFFQLLDSCLRSPLLPAYLAAAFAKKLSRLTLLVPPSGALVIIALIHNLLRRHPSINFLVHREDEGENDKNASESGKECSENPKESITSLDAPRKRGIDYFDYEESDPAKSNAMRSSLWEIDTLRHHYCPAVSRFVTSLENDLTTRARTTEVAIDDFSSGSYATIFRSEVGRRIKQVPLAYYKSSPTSLFSESDFTGWTFKFDKTEREETTTDLNSAKNICGEDEHGTWKRQRTESS